MKKLVLSLSVLLLPMLCMAEITIDEAMSLMKESAGKFINAKSFTIEASVKLSISPTMNLHMYWYEDSYALNVGSNILYYDGKSNWDCDVDSKKISIKKGKDKSADGLVTILLMPQRLGKDMTKIDNKSFKMGKGVCTYASEGDDVVYTMKKDGAKLTLTINLHTKNINKIKVKKGIISTTISYDKVQYSCSPESVVFNIKDFPGAKVKDER